jgi:hypothetical protein
MALKYFLMVVCILVIARGYYVFLKWLKEYDD